MTTPSDPGATPAPPTPSPEPPPAPATGPAPAPEPAPQPRTTPIVSWEAPTEEVGPAPGVKFAPHGGRLLAYIIDTVIVTVILIATTVVLSIVLVAVAGIRSGSGTTAVGAILGLLFVIAILGLSLGYFPYFWAKNGQTPGMRPFNLYVVRDSDGGKMSGAQAFVRLVGMVISGAVFYLGFVWVFIDARRRGWHDLIAGTVVIEKAKPPR